MASICFCIKVSIYCLDESSFDIYMNIAGYYNGAGLFIGSYDGETYSLQYNDTMGYWSFQNINAPSIPIFSNVSLAPNPCSVSPDNWLIDDISNFNYCDDEFDGTIVITDSTQSKIPNPNCGTVFTGGCSCQTLVNTESCTVYYSTCDGILNQQYLPEIGTEITGCFSGSPIFYDGQNPPSLLGTITPFTETTCDYYCITGDSCCLRYYIIGDESPQQSGNVYPIGLFNNKPFFTFTYRLLQTTLTIYYDYLLFSWVLQDAEGSILANLFENTDYCPIGEWYLNDASPLFLFATEEIECPLPTPTPTPTPTQTPIPSGTNECNIITLFQMGVECQVTNPTSISSTDGSAMLIITGGTPPYSVFWDNNNIGTSIYNLGPGSYSAVVTDYYGDYTANTTCVLTGETPTPSPTPTPTPTTPYEQYSLCVSLTLERDPILTTFYSSSIINGKPSWSAGTRTISWSSSTNQWVLSPSPGSSSVINNNPATPPLTGWQILGFPGKPTMQVSLGECELPPLGNPLLRQVGDIQPLSLQYSKNEPICGCEGTLTLIGYGGVSPYSYSINGGLTYRNISMFTNLCSGIYSLSLMDSLGTVVSDSVKLNNPSSPTTYVVSLNTTSNTTINDGSTLGKLYTTTVNVTPKLADDVILTFDISHTDNFKSSPNSNSSSNVNNSNLLKNSNVINVSYSSSTTGTTTNFIAGCQANLIYVTSNTNNWQTVEMTNSDEIIITTVSNVTQNELVPCYVGVADETYSITNLKLSGCGCCNVITE